ncbi:hypothetical protein GCM10007382_15550 [Salinibacterium xinjiangense]|uniref:Apea-like HEPN domain-containing protein n=1 Tax=Salinibacterium xinjiangense TaxID=386302 RepID=A0A2C8YAH5_9MICO|nr:hypothetical protein [Salinibacterium xinjiangense]GGK96158.1 hypothetical protein GCM10007382_15550 [Salinibacterium xinjiangense]SOE47221.1 hypothetical protein SAMN06296378_0204 [Salinibacterium xinjiangense]
MNYMFRFPFDLAETQRINVDGQEMLIFEEGERRIIIRSGTELPIAQVGRLEVRGYGYCSEDEARADGARWKGATAMGLLRSNLGVDFRARQVPHYLTEEGKQHFARFFEARPGERLGSDVPGVSIFQDGSEPARFIRMFTTSRQISTGERALAAIRDSYDETAVPDAAALVAIDMFGSYFHMPSTDAQFLSLMIALEALVVPLPFDGVNADAVASVITHIRTLDLDPSARDSLAARVGHLGEESIGQAGKRVAMGLGDRLYGGLDAPSFFTYCYRMRSAIVHGSENRPDPAELHDAIAALLSFTRDLIQIHVLGKTTSG